MNSQEPEKFRTPSAKETAGRFFEKKLSQYGIAVYDKGYCKKANLSSESTLSETVDRLLIPMAVETEGESYKTAKSLRSLSALFQGALADDKINVKNINKIAKELQDQYTFYTNSEILFKKQAEDPDEIAEVATKDVQRLMRDILGRKCPPPKLTRESMVANRQRIIEDHKSFSYLAQVYGALYDLLTDLAATKKLPLPPLPDLHNKSLS